MKDFLGQPLHPGLTVLIPHRYGNGFEWRVIKTITEHGTVEFEADKKKKYRKTKASYILIPTDEQIDCYNNHISK